MTHLYRPRRRYLGHLTHVQRCQWQVMPPIRSKKREGALVNRKKQHVSAEKRRREAIRRGFDQLTAIVPNLISSQSRSEAIVLDEALKLLRSLKHENMQLRSLADHAQLKLPDTL